MKARYLEALAGIILSCSITGCFLPFTATDRPRSFAETDDKVISEMRTEGLNRSTPFYLNEIDTKVVRRFATTYWNASDASWVPYSGGYVVSFTMDGIAHRAYYTRSGDLECTILQYAEKDMPADIRHMVKSAYYDYSIFIVNEIIRRGKTSFVVKIEDKTSFKELTIDDNGMQLTNAFTKSK